MREILATSLLLLLSTDVFAFGSSSVQGSLTARNQACSELHANWFSPMPISYMKLNGKTAQALSIGETVTSAIGPNATVINSSNMMFRSGRLDESLFYDGTGALSFGPSATLKIPFPFTVAMWVKVDVIPSTGTANDLFSSDNWGVALYSGYHVSLNAAGQLTASIGSALGGNSPPYRRGVISTTSLTTNTWTHVAATFTSATNIKLYMNGAPLATTADGGGASVLGYSTGNVVLGGHSASAPSYAYFKGQIDEAAVWNSALSSTSIAQLYSSQICP